MTDVTGAPQRAETFDRVLLTRLFTDHHGRLVEHLVLLGTVEDIAEDWAMETWERATASIEACPMTRPAAWTWLRELAAEVATAHGRRPRREVPADLTGEELLPHSPSAEDEALTARDLAADEPAPWGVAA